MSSAAWVQKEYSSLLIRLHIFYALMLMTPHHKINPLWYSIFKYTVSFRLPQEDSLVFVLMKYQYAKPGIIHFTLIVNGSVELNLFPFK